MDKSFKRVGIDIGKSCVKYVSEHGAGEIPSYVSRGTLTQVINDPLTPSSAIHYEGADWILGADALLGNNFSLKTDEGKSDPRYLLFIQHILAKYGIENAEIVVGLPVSLAESKKMVAAVKEMFSGRKEAVVNGKPMTFFIKTHVLPEPLGTYFSMILDENGRTIKTSPFFHERIGIVDIGFRTLDIVTLQGGKTAAMKVSTMNGTISFFEKVWKLIEYHHGMLQWTDKVRILHDVAINFGKTSLRANGEYISPAIWEKIAELRAQLALDISDDVKSVLSSLKPDKMLITGGGALLLKDDLTRHMRQIFFHPNPRYANAIGFYRAANLIAESSS